MYEKFIAEANLNPDNFSDAWAFGNTPQMADELLELVLEGKKSYSKRIVPVWTRRFLPAVDGRYEILLDGKGNPRAAIQTSKVYITKFNKVTEDHAFNEGEGDRSLAYWRQVHEAFPRFRLLCTRYGYCL